MAIALLILLGEQCRPEVAQLQGSKVSGESEWVSRGGEVALTPLLKIANSIPVTSHLLVACIRCIDGFKRLINSIR
ncbi:hypothetical protein BDW75DRAFT_222553 [Aspergillus navahoensis]